MQARQSVGSGGLCDGGTPNERHDRRQDLGRPKDRLFGKGPLRVMSESRRPISFGIRKLPARPSSERPDRPFDNWDFAGATPRRNPLPPLT